MMSVARAPGCAMFLVSVLAVQTAGDGLIAHYPLDETSGILTIDASRKDHPAEIQGDPQWMEGPFGTALRLDGEDDYVDCGEDFTLGSQGTVSLWCRPEASLATSRHRSTTRTVIPPSGSHDRIMR